MPRCLCGVVCPWSTEVKCFPDYLDTFCSDGKASKHKLSSFYFLKKIWLTKVRYGHIPSTDVGDRQYSCTVGWFAPTTFFVLANTLVTLSSKTAVTYEAMQWVDLKILRDLECPKLVEHSVFTESGLRPIQSSSRNVRVCLSHRA